MNQSMQNNFDQDMDSQNSRFHQKPQNSFNFKVSLCGKKKKIKKGKYKGYEGIIKNVFGDHAKFELSAVCKVISIPLKHLGIDPNQGDMKNSAFANEGEAKRNFDEYANMNTPALNPASREDRKSVV